MSQYPPQPPPPYPSPLTPATSLPPRRPRRHLFAWIFFIALAVVLFLLLSQTRDAAPRGTPIPLSEFTERLQTNQVRRIVVTRDEIRGEFVRPLWTPGSRAQDPPHADALHFHTDLPNGLGESWGFVDWLLTHRGDAVVTAENDSGNVLINILLPVIPWLLIFGFIWFFVFRQLRRQIGAVTIPLTHSPPAPPPPPTSS